MILTDREIQAAIQTRQMTIEPAPRDEAFSSTSVDLTLAAPLRIWKRHKVAGVEAEVICPVAPGYNYTSLARSFTDATEIPAGGYVMEPGAFLLAWTAERVHLPTQARLAARVEGKSSLARLGIGVHITAPTIHAGFSGPIQLEMCNHGTLRVRLMAGMPVCQLIFELTLGTPAKGYAGQFLGQSRE